MDVTLPWELGGLVGCDGEDGFLTDLHLANVVFIHIGQHFQVIKVDDFDESGRIESCNHRFSLHRVDRGDDAFDRGDNGGVRKLRLPVIEFGLIFESPCFGHFVLCFTLVQFLGGNRVSRHEVVCRVQSPSADDFPRPWLQREPLFEALPLRSGHPVQSWQ